MSANKPTRPAPRQSRAQSRAKTLRATGKLLRQLILAARARFDDELRPNQITSAQLRILFEVRTHPGASGAQLARAGAVTPQTTHAMLAQAVQRGWLTRGKDAENHRLVTFTLTPAGAAMLEHGETTYAAIETELWRGIKTEEVKAIGTVFEKALTNLEKPTTQGAPKG